MLSRRLPLFGARLYVLLARPLRLFFRRLALRSGLNALLLLGPIPRRLLILLLVSAEVLLILSLLLFLIFLGLLLLLLLDFLFLLGSVAVGSRRHAIV